MEEITADVVEIAWKLEREPEDVNEFTSCNFMIKFQRMKELLLMDQNQWLVDIDSTPSEDAVNIFETTIKDWEYYINSVGKAVAETYLGCKTGNSRFTSPVKNFFKKDFIFK